MASPEQNQHRDIFNDRPRLPSFSNFLNATSRPDLPYERQIVHSPFANRPATTGGDSKFSNSSDHASPSEQFFNNQSYPPQLYPTEQPSLGRLPDIAHQPAIVRQNAKVPILTEPFTSPTSVRPSIPPRLHRTTPLFEGSRTRIVIGEEMIPGKGLCFRYDDGSLCPKVINGDTVNPDWGTTKTGKPRKRLGQACNTCREKKIKCDPSLPKCQQCQKFGRECKFATTSRSSSQKHLASHSSREDLDADVEPVDRSDEAKATIHTSADVSPHERSYSRSASKSSIALDHLLSPPTTGNIYDDDDSSEVRRASKKMRVSSDSPENQDRGTVNTQKTTHETSMDLESSSSPSKNRFNTNSDPFEVDPDITSYYLSNYFLHINNTAYCILPRRIFMKWVKESKQKSKWDIMLLYAMLALGTVFSKDKDSKMHRDTFLEIVQQLLIQTSGVFELQVVLTRFFLSSIALAQGESNKSWELCGAAIRAATGMDMNVEDAGDKSTFEREQNPFSFDFVTLAECKRRTFWSLYVMDCFNGVFSGHILSIHRSNCFLRLPCQDVMYEAGKAQEMPYFHQQIPPDANAKNNAFLDLGMMAFLVQIATIFSDIVHEINHTRLQSTENYESQFEVFFQSMNTLMQQWEKALKRNLVLSPPDREYRGLGTPPETISGLHILFHYSAMLLHRHVHYHDTNYISIARNVQGANNHARRTLEILQRLSSQELRDIPLLRFAAYCPLVAYVATTAIDIITAAGPVSEFLEIQNRSIELVAGGIEVLDVLAEHWHPARILRAQVKDRISTVFTACKTGSANKKKAFFIAEPLISPFGRDLDVVYGLPRLQYLHALGRTKTAMTIDDLYEPVGSADSASSM